MFENCKSYLIKNINFAPRNLHYLALPCSEQYMQNYFYFVYLLIRCELLTHLVNNFNKTYAYLISFLQQMSIILCSL